MEQPLNNKTALVTRTSQVLVLLALVRWRRTARPWSSWALQRKVLRQP